MSMDLLEQLRADYDKNERKWRRVTHAEYLTHTYDRPMVSIDNGCLGSVKHGQSYDGQGIHIAFRLNFTTTEYEAMLVTEAEWKSYHIYEKKHIPIAPPIIGDSGMNQFQASLIDRSHKILPGGTGEQEFYLEKMASIRQALSHYCESCGGYLVKQGANLILDCQNGAWRLEFDAGNILRLDNFEAYNPYLLRIWECGYDESEVAWWDARHARVISCYYQTGNTDQPRLIEFRED